MPVTVTAHKGQVPFVDFDKDYLLYAGYDNAETGYYAGNKTLLCNDSYRVSSAGS